MTRGHTYFCRFGSLLHAGFVVYTDANNWNITICFANTYVYSDIPIGFGRRTEN